MPFKAVLVCKFVIIDKWKICCVREDGQDFGNFEESLCQGMLFDIKNWTYYWKGVFAPLFWKYIFSFIIWLAEDMKVLKNKFPIHNTFFLLRMGHEIFNTFVSSAS